MDQASTSTTSPSGLIEPTRRRDRRREKQQLSCNFCRSRKIRCDRQLPCKTCISKDIALSCTYTPDPQRKEKAVSVADRIQQLEALVRSLVQQQQQQQQLQLQPDSNGSGAATTSSAGMPSEHDEMRLHSHGLHYVSSVHWAAILDSISDLNDSYETERETAMLAPSPGPRLLYEPAHATRDEIISSIPTRPVVDRMVARYFNTQGVAPAVLSSGQFLQEYEHFWQDPSATSFAWIGLLFSIMCLSTQYKQLTEEPAEPDSLINVHLFRERTVHCLVLGHYTKGGPHVLETMLIHLTSEILMYKDAEIGLWLLLGVVVQLALSLGYHRDPQNFPDLSPFAGEMRRRVWAVIVQMDLRLSSQMGLPRLLKSHQCDTREPRNLLDSDFNEASVELPPSRPETEVTPVLYGLAKARIDSIGVLISDLIADIRDHPLSEIMYLDKELHNAEASLPQIFQWQPLSQSLMIPPQILLHRLVLQLAVQRLVISLHRRYLAVSYAADERYTYSREACVQAAIKIFEFQQIIYEETQPDGLLYPMRRLRSSLLQSIFLLGMSVLCYYAQQLTKSASNGGAGAARPLLDRDKILDLLRSTYPIWLRASTMSQDARKAVEHLNLVLGLPPQHSNTPPPLADTTPLAFSTASNNTDGQDTWDAYQGIADFPQVFDATDLMVWDVPGLSSSRDVSSTDWL